LEQSCCSTTKYDTGDFNPNAEIRPNVGFAHEETLIKLIGEANTKIQEYRRDLQALPANADWERDIKPKLEQVLM
jgi:hypothetical protein